MKRLTKWLVTLLMTVSLFFASSFKCVEVKAVGFPTIDISNLVQNILGFIEDQMREGSFLEAAMGSVTKIENTSEQFKKMKEQWETFLGAIQYLKAANSVFRSIALLDELVNVFLKDCENFESIEHYLSDDADVIDLMNTGINILHSYQQIYRVLIEVGKERIKAYEDMKHESALELIAYTEDTVAEIYQTYFVIRRIYARRYVNFYREYTVARVVNANINYLNHFIYGTPVSLRAGGGL